MVELLETNITVIVEIESSEAQLNLLFSQSILNFIHKPLELTYVEQLVLIKIIFFIDLV
jgi:hypothetical protein